MKGLSNQQPDVNRKIVFDPHIAITHTFHSKNRHWQTAQSQDQVKIVFFLHVVVCEDFAVLQLLAVKD